MSDFIKFGEITINKKVITRLFRKRETLILWCSDDPLWLKLCFDSDEEAQSKYEAVSKILMTPPTKINISCSNIKINSDNSVETNEIKRNAVENIKKGFDNLEKEFSHLKTQIK